MTQRLRGALRRVLAAALAMIIAAPLAAQTMTVSAVSANTPNFGNVAASAVGDTVFRISTAPAVTRVSGMGGVLASGTRTRATVTIRCQGGSGCTTATAYVRIAPRTNVTGRAGTVSNFTVASGTGTVGTTSPQGDGSLLLTLTGFSGNSTRTFYVGMDMPVKGDNVSTSTTATAGWTVAVARFPTVPAATGTNVATRATVRRSLSVTKTADLAFGAVGPPAAGTGTVAIAAASGARSAGGASAPRLVPGQTSGRALFTVSGQPSSSVSVNIPATVALAHSQDGLTATLQATQSGNVTLSTGGALTIGVGGTLTVPSATLPGDYSGSFTVTVAYN
ncbi:MAG: DUF4402 domain-containing protein [Alphaproteobacteria bacterium]|nr:DUF4402 domain-containing protein [Alphaproteobacteria bacterium]